MRKSVRTFPEERELTRLISRLKREEKEEREREKKEREQREREEAARAEEEALAERRRLRNLRRRDRRRARQTPTPEEGQELEEEGAQVTPVGIEEQEEGQLELPGPSPVQNPAPQIAVDTTSPEMAQGGGQHVPEVEQETYDMGAWGPVITWLREDPTLHAWLTDAEGNLLASDRRTQLPVWKAIFQYQGFDIKRILRNMVKNYDKYLTDKQLSEVKFSVIVNNQPREFVYTNKETMMADIEFLIFLFAERGSTNKKYTGKSIDQVKVITDWLVEKYGLDTDVNLPLTSLAPDTITIPRIVACFPGKICEYYHRGYGNSLATFHDIGIGRPGNLSRSVLCPHFTALMPRSIARVSNSMNYISFVIHIVVDDILHKKAENYTALDNILTYFSAEFNSPGTPHESRMNFCRHMGLLSPTGERFVEMLERQRDFCINAIRELRPNDPKLEAVITEVGRLH